MSEVSYVMRKSFGWVGEKQKNEYVPKGTVLVAGKDDALISTLFRKGAAIEPIEVQVETPPAPAATPAEQEKTKAGKK
jgi:hypothetical protein